MPEPEPMAPDPVEPGMLPVVPEPVVPEPVVPEPGVGGVPVVGVPVPAVEAPGLSVLGAPVPELVIEFSPLPAAVVVGSFAGRSLPHAVAIKPRAEIPSAIRKTFIWIISASDAPRIGSLAARLQQPCRACA